MSNGEPKFTLSFSFSCICGNKIPSEFYTMPVEGLRGDNTFGFIDNRFRIVCKKCKEEFITELFVRRFSDVEVKGKSTKDGEPNKG